MILLIIGIGLGIIVTLIWIELKFLWLARKTKEITKTWRGE